MKQIQVTPDILSMIRKAAGPDVNVDNLAVFEASAINTIPVRKRHPLYNKAVHSRSLLQEMATAVGKESRPVLLQHNDGPLPSGRVFAGTVIDGEVDSELRTLFWVDKTHPDVIALVNNGTVDQVSVSILPQKALCSECGFDFLGPDANFDMFFSGTDPEGHIMGEDGAHVRLTGLDSWFEMSLVGQGGIQNARIVSREQSKFGSNGQRLAASGLDPSAFLLTATATPKRNEQMDPKEFITQLTANVTELTTVKAQVATLTASVTEKDAKIAELTAKVTEASKAAPEKDTKITELSAQLKLATDSLKDVAKNVLVATGDVDPKIPEGVTEIVALISDTGKGLAAALVAGGKSKSAIDDAGKKTGRGYSTGFKTAR